MTPAQIKAALALNACSFLPGSWDKRFARDIAAIAISTPEKSLTEKQLQAFEMMLKRYRKQLGGLKHFEAVSNEPRPESGSVVLGGMVAQPRLFDVVLGGDRNEQPNP